MKQKSLKSDTYWSLFCDIFTIFYSLYGYGHYMAHWAPGLMTVLTHDTIIIIIQSVKGFNDILDEQVDFFRKIEKVILSSKNDNIKIASWFTNKNV